MLHEGVTEVPLKKGEDPPGRGPVNNDAHDRSWDRASSTKLDSPGTDRAKKALKRLSVTDTGGGGTEQTNSIPRNSPLYLSMRGPKIIHKAPFLDRHY